jgi:hypothetical protein
MRLKYGSICLAAAVIACAATSASAAVVSKYQYRLGEDDAGAAAGVQGNNPTSAFVGGIARSKTVSVAGQTYSADVPSATTTGSTLSMDFSTTPNFDGYSGANGGLVGNADNYVFETWVKSTENGGDSIIAYMGSSTGANVGSANGYGFKQSGNSYTAAFAGIGEYVLAPISTTAWTHLAIVRDSAAGGGNNQGVRAYVNGVQVALANQGAVPITPFGNLEIGGAEGGTNVFNGKVDDVRYSTFTSGNFVASDLLVSVPEPASLGLLALGGAMLLRRRSK